MKTNIKTLVTIAMLTAACALVIWLMPIPLSFGEYVHLGDSIIYVAACLLNPFAAAAVGGLGGLVADLVSGYAVWAPFTLVIKSCQGFVCAILLKMLGKKKLVPQLIAMAAATIVMTIGYFAASWLLYGFTAAIAGVPFNLLQGAAGLIIATILLQGGLKRIEIEKPEEQSITEKD